MVASVAMRRRAAVIRRRRIVFSSGRA